LIEIVAASLDLDIEEVHPGDLLFADLDADSLDILDINYRVSQKHGIELPLAELKRRFEDADIPWLDDDGCVTAVGLAEVQSFLPELIGDRIKVGDRIEAVFHVLTVDDLTEMLWRKLRTSI
jgi:acyl carrier protein